MILTATVLDIVRTQLGVHEQGGNNTGPEVDQYLAAVGLDPGYAWCAAFLYWCFRKATSQVGLAMINPFPRTASSQKVWTFAEPLCRMDAPAEGCVYVLQHTPATGHVGIVESIGEDGVICEISGNTFAESGGREGNTVARHYGDPAVTHGGRILGWLDFDLAAQPPPGF